jgi:hypothetical protein
VVDVSTDLIHWTKAADITAVSGTASYTDPALIAAAPVRFYRVLALPAGVVPRVSVIGSEFTLNWAAESGAQFQIRTSSDLIHWTIAATLTTDSATGAYSEPINHKAARFYQLLRTQ